MAKVTIENSIAAGNGEAGFRVSGDGEIIVRNSLAQDNAGPGFDLGQPVSAKSRWYDRPVGRVTLAIIGTVTAAMIMISVRWVLHLPS